MSPKFKRLGVALLAFGAMGAMAVINASAKSGGHFVSSATHTIVDQRATTTQGIPHFFNIKIENTGEFECKYARALGTISTPLATVTEANGITELDECFTVGSTETPWQVHENGCEGRPTVATGEPATTEQTGDLICPPGKVMEVTHPNCLITVPSQNHIPGFTYTRITENGKHAITVDVNVQYAVQYHGGICIFLGTSHTATVTGSTIVRGLNTNGEQVSITAT